MAYSIRFEFDAEGEPPKVMIYDIADGCAVLEVFEEPICKLGGKLVDDGRGVWDWEGPWSWEQEDWEPGEMAAHVLSLLELDPWEGVE